MPETPPRPLCFMVMPFGSQAVVPPADNGVAAIDFDALWTKAFEPVIRELGYEPVLREVLLTPDEEGRRRCAVQLASTLEQGPLSPSIAVEVASSCATARDGRTRWATSRRSPRSTASWTRWRSCAAAPLPRTQRRGRRRERGLRRAPGTGRLRAGEAASSRRRVGAADAPGAGVRRGGRGRRPRLREGGRARGAGEVEARDDRRRPRAQQSDAQVRQTLQDLLVRLRSSL